MGYLSLHFYLLLSLLSAVATFSISAILLQSTPLSVYICVFVCTPTHSTCRSRQAFLFFFFSFFLYLSAQLLLNRRSHMAITQALIRVNAANTNALVFLTHLEETDLLFFGVIIKTTWPLIGCDVRTVAHFVKRCTPLLLV